jgi:hypothetical protein
VNLNFDYGEYEPDFDRLQNISQDDLVQNLRRQGRLQAANQNKDGVGGQPGPSGGDEKSPTKEPVASPKK